MSKGRQLTLADLSDPREAVFVAALFDLGGPQHGPEAAVRAGYAKTQDEAERASAFLLGSSRISRAIVGEIKSRFDVAALAAFNVLLEVATDKKAPANARVSAAESILNRSSIGPVPSRSLGVVAHTGVEELLAQLDAQDRQRSAASAQVIDGQAVEVDAAHE